MGFKYRIKFKNITYRWVINFISIVSIFLILTNTIFFITIKKYFYKYAEQTIKINSDDHFNNISKQIETYNNYDILLKNMVENFANADNITLLCLNSDGEVIYNSSKFDIEKFHFFKNLIKKAIENSSDISIEKTNNKEHIMAYTLPLPIINDDLKALMYVTSLNKIDSIIKTILLITTILSIIILFLVISSGVFFIKNFVEPIREIEGFIKKIADGKLNYKINKNFHYEIKNLCDSINFMANKLSKSENLKNEFISSVSHELRTPLTAIQGWGETIMNSKYEDKKLIEKGIKVINKEVKRLSSMVEELLDFSKIQSGHFILKKEKMDLFAELEEVIIIYSEIAKKEEKFIDYLENQTDIPIIYGDKNRIRQVFINIIDNSIKYSNPGDIITISATIKGEKAEIIIKDTGCGIEKKDLPRITEKFFKSNSSKKGSGIGLSVVKEIVKMHSGDLKFFSTPKKGTTVKVYFPIFKNNDIGV